MRRQVERRAAGQRHHAGLGRGVVGLALLRAPADHRGVVDDHALLAGGDHPLAGGPDAAEGAGQGDVEDLEPLLVGHLQDARGAAEAGVVDHDVDAAELVGRVEQRADLGLVGDVADQLAHPVGAELLGQRLLGLREPALVGVAEDDRLRALLQRPSYDGRADAGAGGGRHDDDLAGQQVVAGDVVGGGLLGSGGGHPRASRGRPSTRSARMLRCTSSLPP